MRGFAFYQYSMEFDGRVLFPLPGAPHFCLASRQGWEWRSKCFPLFEDVIKKM